MTITDPIYEDHEFAPDPRSAFGPIVSAFEVEHALATVVRVWIRDYLAEVARQRGLDPESYPPFRSIVATARNQRFLEDQLPSLVMVSPRMLPGTGQRGHIEAHGDGSYLGRWRIDAGAVVSARGNRQAVKLARLYTAALSALLLQQAADPRWTPLPTRRVDMTGERYDEIEATSDRTLCQGVGEFVVEIDNARNWFGGPSVPTYPREALLPEIERVVIDVDKFPPEEGS